MAHAPLGWEQLADCGAMRVVGLRLRPGQRVPDGVIAHVPHVNVPGRIGEHFQDVILLARGIHLGLEELLLSPTRLPLRLDFLRVVGWVHSQNRL